MQPAAVRDSRTTTIEATMVRRRRTAKPSRTGYGNCDLGSSEAECNRDSSSLRFNKPGNTAADAAALAPLPSCLLA